jgi:hypothetical protein
MSKTRFVIPAALALAAALGSGVAQARDADVQWSVTIGSPAYGRPQPVYTVPVPVYRQPAPVYHQRPVYPLYGHRPAYPAVRYHQPTRWDRDGDGIANRHDRLYNPHWDIDGDGIPNRHDRHDRARWDNDRDGVPNRYDRYDNNPWRR